MRKPLPGNDINPNNIGWKEQAVHVNKTNGKGRSHSPKIHRPGKFRAVGKFMRAYMFLLTLEYRGPAQAILHIYIILYKLWFVNLGRQTSRAYVLFCRAPVIFRTMHNAHNFASSPHHPCTVVNSHNSPILLAHPLRALLPLSS